MTTQPTANWEAGDRYERYVGRWSRPVARIFLEWLAVAPGSKWLDVGCGTGSLVETILAQSEPQAVLGIDRSAGFLATARQQISDPRAQFRVGDAMNLPMDAATYDVAVSGLVLNFVPDPAAMVREMRRVTKPGGKLALYVWDYAEGMAMMRHFWQVALAVNPQDARLDETNQFPLCRPDALAALWQEVGLTAVEVRAIEIPTVFQNFADYWTPFLGQQGSAPTYLMSLDAETQEQIRARLQARLLPAADGTIALTARAWAVQGTVPQSS